MKRKNSEKMLELQYSIEILEEEVEDLKELARIKQERIVELIGENDRLTMTYEPYRPPGDEHENFDFYGLVEDNKELTHHVRRLQEKNNLLVSELVSVKTAINEMKIAKETTEPKKPRIKNERWWNVSLELWPGAWGLNYYRYKWEKYGSKSREGQVQIGPLGFSWNREPKDRSH